MVNLIFGHLDNKGALGQIPHFWSPTLHGHSTSHCTGQQGYSESEYDAGIEVLHRPGYGRESDTDPLALKWSIMGLSPEPWQTLALGV